MIEIKTYAPFIGIRLLGLDYYLWFERGKYRADAIIFKGKHGWDNSNSSVNIECLRSEIKSVIYADNLPLQ